MVPWTSEIDRKTREKKRVSRPVSRCDGKNVDQLWLDASREEAARWKMARHCSAKDIRNMAQSTCSGEVDGAKKFEMCRTLIILPKTCTMGETQQIDELAVRHHQTPRRRPARLGGSVWRRRINERAKTHESKRAPRSLATPRAFSAKRYKNLSSVT